MPSPSDPVFQERLTDRLKWSLLASPSTIQVLDMDANSEPQWYPLLAEPHHRVAMQPITDTQRSRMLVILDFVEYAEYYSDSGDEVPAPLVIENLDGTPICVAQFVHEVHVYVVGLRDVIYELEDRVREEEAVYYFMGASGPRWSDAGDEDARFGVWMSSDVVKNDEKILEEIWQGQVRRFVEEQREERG
jgi:hypothetical protein